MMKRRFGRIIGIASVVGVTGNAGQANYSASKAGMIAMNKCLAQEVGSRGITVNSIAPGFIRTPMTDVLPEDVKAALLAKIPEGKLGEAQDIANVVAFLASDEAQYITGQSININLKRRTKILRFFLSDSAKKIIPALPKPVLTVTSFLPR